MCDVVLLTYRTTSYILSQLGIGSKICVFKLYIQIKGTTSRHSPHQEAIFQSHVRAKTAIQHDLMHKLNILGPSSLQWLGLSNRVLSYLISLCWTSVSKHLRFCNLILILNGRPLNASSLKGWNIKVKWSPEECFSYWDSIFLFSFWCVWRSWVLVWLCWTESTQIPLTLSGLESFTPRMSRWAACSDWSPIHKPR